jgi:tRNA threonylcarbamoyladenosine biosynthesis protein TsaE
VSFCIFLVLQRSSIVNEKIVNRQLLTMLPQVFVTDSADETIALGAQLAPSLRDARIVLLRGDLGAGKTTLVKGIAEAFQAAAQDDVTSPTFTLVHEYRGPERTLYHIDLYRIDTERELATLGLEDISNEEGSLLLIEWGEKFERLLQLRDIEIVLERTGENSRKLTLTSAN